MYKYMLVGLLALGACSGPLQSSQSSLGATEHTAAASGGNPGSIAYPPRSQSAGPMDVAQANGAVAHTQAGAGEQE